MYKKYKLILLLITTLLYSSFLTANTEWRAGRKAVRNDDPNLNTQLGAYYKGIWESLREPEVCIVGLRWGKESSKIQSNDLIIGQIASSGASSVEIVFESSDFKEDNKIYCYKGKIYAQVQLRGLGRKPQCSQCDHYRFHRWDHWGKGTTLVSRDLRVNDLCMFRIPFSGDKYFKKFQIKDVLVNGHSVGYIIKFNTQPALTNTGLKVPDPPRVRYHSASITKEKVFLREDKPIEEEEIETNNDSNQSHDTSSLQSNQIEVGIHIPAGHYFREEIDVLLTDEKFSIIGETDKPIYVNKKEFSRTEAQRISLADLGIKTTQNPKIKFISLPRGTINGKNFKSTRRFKILPNDKSNYKPTQSGWYHFIITFE